MLLMLAMSFADEPQFGRDASAESSGITDTLGKTKIDGENWWVSGSSSGSNNAFRVLDEFSCADPWQSTYGVANMKNSLLAAFIIIFALLIIYLAGHFFQSPQLLAIAKDEGRQLIVLMLVVAILAGVMVAGNMWYRLDTARLPNPGLPTGTTALSGVPDAGLASAQEAYDLYTAGGTTRDRDITEAAMSYSRLMVFKISNEMTALAVYNAVVHTLYSSTLWFGITWRAMWNFNLGPALKPIIDALGIIMQFLGVALGEWVLHIILLCFLQKWTWGVFFPLGLILYMIPHTRGGGAAIIAIIWSLSLIYPLMLIANYEIYRLTSASLVSGDYVVREFINSSGIGGFGLLGLVLVFTMGGVIMPFFAGLAINVLFELVRNAIYYIVVISLLLPFINIFITLTAAREVALGFGTNVNFMSFMRLI